MLGIDENTASQGKEEGNGWSLRWDRIGIVGWGIYLFGEDLYTFIYLQFI